MATTTNYSWTTPDNTAYVKDGAVSDSDTLAARLTQRCTALQAAKM
jgi:hypothetical protein